MKKSTILWLAVLLCCVLAGCAAGVPQQEYDDIVAERDALQLRLAENLATLEALEAELAQSQAQATQLAEQIESYTLADPPPEAKTGTADAETSVAVYITDSGTKYHQANCPSAQKSQYATTVAEAQKQGYTACGKCRPPA